MLFIFIVLGVFPETRLALFVGLGWLALLSAAYWLWGRPGRSRGQPPSFQRP
jgi:histidine transporter